MMEDLKKDLATLKLDVNSLETLTVKEARNAYWKIALKIHPDK
jgi:DnaJ-class molecular chaperone